MKKVESLCISLCLWLFWARGWAGRGLARFPILDFIGTLARAAGHSNRAGARRTGRDNQYVPARRVTGRPCAASVGWSGHSAEARAVIRSDLAAGRFQSGLGACRQRPVDARPALFHEASLQQRTRGERVLLD